MKVNITFPKTETPLKYSGWRVKHKIEDGWDRTPPGMPEVLPPIDPLSVAMTRDIQWMSYNLMTYANPSVTKKQWEAVHDYDRAFNNYSGFNDPDDPRANFIANENISYILPTYDKSQRVCGGSFITGQARGDYLYCISGVDGIDPDKPMPTTSEILANNWFIHAVSVNDDFTKISHFPQGNGGVVLIPFIFRGTIKFPLYCFEKWESDELPDPLRIYVRN